MSSEPVPVGGSETPSTDFASYFPKATIFCVGTPIFRSRAARDLGCLLDVDLDVEGWECQTHELRVRARRHAPDFLVVYQSGVRWLLHTSDGEGDPAITEAAIREGYRHRFVSREEREGGYRLRNARDLLRYGNFRCPLGDRIRVLSALDEVGSFTLAEGLGLFREVAPVAGLATLILQRILTVDLDEELLNPDTIVRRGEQ